MTASRPESRNVVPSVVRTVTHRFQSAAELEAYGRGEAPGVPLYSRYDNPTVENVEAELAALLGAERACLFGSGMAAATTALLTFARAGEELLASRLIYGGVYKFLRDTAPRWGLTTRLVDPAGLLDGSAFGPTTRLVHLESPVNPTLRVLDVKAIAEQARGRGAITMVDATFGPPPLQRFDDLGADLVMHSATKYLNGHSDVLAGVVAGKAEHVERVRSLRKILGGTLDPFAASELLRGMRTLEVRLERQQATARLLAARLEAHPRVERAFHPDLPSHPDHALAQRVLRGGGAVVSFVVQGGYAGAVRVFDRVQHFARAASLGGVESLITLPRVTSHAALSAAEREAAGVADGLVRIAVGLEPVELLWRDLEQALEVSP